MIRRGTNWSTSSGWLAELESRWILRRAAYFEGQVLTKTIAKRSGGVAGLEGSCPSAGLGHRTATPVGLFWFQQACGVGNTGYPRLSSAQTGSINCCGISDVNRP